MRPSDRGWRGGSSRRSARRTAPASLSGSPASSAGSPGTSIRPTSSGCSATSRFAGTRRDGCEKCRRRDYIVGALTIPTPRSAPRSACGAWSTYTTCGRSSDGTSEFAGSSQTSRCANSGRLANTVGCPPSAVPEILLNSPLRTSIFDPTARVADLPRSTCKGDERCSEQHSQFSSCFEGSVVGDFLLEARDSSANWMHSPARPHDDNHGGGSLLPAQLCRRTRRSAPASRQ